MKEILGKLEPAWFGVWKQHFHYTNSDVTGHYYVTAEGMVL